LPTILLTENLIELTKNVQGKTLAAIEDTSLKSIDFPETKAIAILIITPDKIAIIGIKIAQTKPITACL
jgi:ethanolamine utilization microcompartment shell protein EutS